MYVSIAGTLVSKNPVYSELCTGDSVDPINGSLMELTIQLYVLVCFSSSSDDS